MKNILLIIILILSSNSFCQKKVKNKTKKSETKTVTAAKPADKVDVITVQPPVNQVVENKLSVNEPQKIEEPKKIIIEEKDCKYFQNYKNNFETYKSTRLSLVYLRNYSGTNERIYFSLAKKNEIPYINAELIYKGSNEEYGSDKCFGDNSKIVFTLKGGKIITLLHIEADDCYKNQVNGVRDVSRNLSGSFRLLQEDIEALKANQLESMQVVFQTGQQDYVFQTTAYSEVENNTYEPQIYFQKYLNCITN